MPIGMENRLLLNEWKFKILLFTTQKSSGDGQSFIPFFPSGDDILANFSNEEGSHWNKGVSSFLACNQLRELSKEEI